jgi:hypothetical protein
MNAHTQTQSNPDDDIIFALGLKCWDLSVSILTTTAIYIFLHFDLRGATCVLVVRMRGKQLSFWLE